MDQKQKVLGTLRMSGNICGKQTKLSSHVKELSSRRHLKSHQSARENFKVGIPGTEVAVK